MSKSAQSLEKSTHSAIQLKPQNSSTTDKRCYCLLCKAWGMQVRFASGKCSEQLQVSSIAVHWFNCFWRTDV